MDSHAVLSRKQLKKVEWENVSSNKVSKNSISNYLLDQSVYMNLFFVRIHVLYIKF